LSSQALRKFFNLDETDQIPEEISYILDQTELIRFDPGDTITKEGDFGDALFVIDSGSADVISDSSGGMVIGEVNEGDFFGEVALMTGGLRTATIMARTPMLVFKIYKDGIDYLSEVYPHIAGTLLQKIYTRLSSSYFRLEQKNAELRQLSHMRLELASLFTNVVLLITLYTFILGLINSDFFALRFDLENYYLFSRIIEAATLLMVLKIIVNSSLEWKHFGLTTLGARNSIIESILVSVAVMALLYWAKLILMRYYPASFAGEEVIDFSYFDWTYITYLVVAPLQEFITRGVVQSTLQRLLVGRYSWLSAIVITSLLFGSLHLFSSLYLGLAALVSSWLWGWMYHRHQNLIGVSISHFLIGNFVGLLGFWVYF
jgi:CRP-like cAMP-binding protein